MDETITSDEAQAGLKISLLQVFAAMSIVCAALGLCHGLGLKPESNVVASTGSLLILAFRWTPIPRFSLSLAYSLGGIAAMTLFALWAWYVCRGDFAYRALAGDLSEDIPIDGLTVLLAGSMVGCAIGCLNELLIACFDPNDPTWRNSIEGRSLPSNRIWRCGLLVSGLSGGTLLTGYLAVAFLLPFYLDWSVERISERNRRLPPVQQIGLILIIPRGDGFFDNLTLRQVLVDCGQVELVYFTFDHVAEGSAEHVALAKKVFPPALPMKMWQGMSYPIKSTRFKDGAICFRYWLWPHEVEAVRKRMTELGGREMRIVSEDDWPWREAP